MKTAESTVIFIL